MYRFAKRAVLGASLLILGPYGSSAWADCTYDYTQGYQPNPPPCQDNPGPAEANPWSHTYQLNDAQGHTQTCTSITTGGITSLQCD